MGVAPESGATPIEVWSLLLRVAARRRARLPELALLRGERRLLTRLRRETTRLLLGRELAGRRVHPRRRLVPVLVVARGGRLDDARLEQVRHRGGDALQDAEDQQQDRADAQVRVGGEGEEQNREHARHGECGGGGAAPPVVSAEGRGRGE